jgi:hypothetical protein
MIGMAMWYLFLGSDGRSVREQLGTQLFRRKLTRYIEADMKMIEVVWSLDL